MTDTLRDVLNGTKRIEAILEEKFAASGRGLYEKMETANMKLPEGLQKRIRYVATLRNKTMHQDGYEIANIPEYVKACQSIAAQLEHLHANRKSNFNARIVGGGIGLFGKIVLAGAGAVGIVGLAFIGMTMILKPGQPGREVETPTAFVPSTAPAKTPAQPLSTSEGRKPEEIEEIEAFNPTHATATATATATAAKPTPTRAVSRLEKADEPVAREIQLPYPSAQEDAAPQRLDTNLALAPVTFRNLQFTMVNGPWGRKEPKASATFVNNHSSTISYVRVHMKLFINDESTPVAGNGAKDGVFYVTFGDQGLAPGASAVGNMHFFGFDKDMWKVPDVVNATSRMVEMKILSAEDGRKHAVPLPQMDWQR
jgi:hypothetical protein